MSTIHAVLEFLNQIDETLFLWINRHLTPPIFDLPMLALSSEVTWGVVALFALVWTFRLSPARRSRHVQVLAVCVVAGLSTDWIAFQYLKPNFMRHRPCHRNWTETRDVTGACGSRYGMPSNHAANAMAVATTARHFYPALGILPFALAIGVGLSRVYLGVHFLGDVLVGFLLGFIVATIEIYFVRLLRKIFIRTRLSKTKLHSK